ncbi:uncharacterized protein EKO05_0008758 [Ascochyta rabiei]|uniref:Uncharacterized protein n=1 Tax=Didymella rabiei TaxID=5454 RepID=A0A163JXX4_DIDRA|nr:uncharacterized protein EKO05_0008758 [Ascochyta rabiei]KZM26658.1 hypothetical protein ST47_g2196 [Ascochyta rabiei]UPX18459.1 hypothetical protein EKO05_0008758 [Ascochyta rabiei]
MGLKRRADVIASVERKKRDKRLSPLHQEVGALDDQSRGHIVAAGSNVESDVKMEVNSEAKVRWRELKAAKTEREEIERFKRQQARTHTKAEAAHNEDLHKARLRMMRARKVGYEAEQETARMQEPAHGFVLEANWNVEQDTYDQAERNGNEEGPETKRSKGSPTSTPTASSAIHPIADTPKRKHRLLDDYGDWIASSAFKRSILERTDSAILPDEDQHQTPPPSTPWRNTKRQRNSLNVDRSRIDTHFILSDEFIDDVNTMLDFVAGWPEEHFTDIRYSFKKDPENQDRRIKFAHTSDGEWAVHILKPVSLEPERRHGLADVYTLDDLPDSCREHGCIEGCPRKISLEERITDLKKFRESQNNGDPLNAMAGPRSSPEVLSDTRMMPPPPIPPRSDKRRLPQGVGNFRIMPTHPSESFMTAYNLEQLQRRNIYMENEIRQLKMKLSQTKDQMFGGKGMEMWPQNDPGSDAGSDAFQSSRKDTFFGKLDYGPLGGKLVHTDRIPSGSNSVRVEEYMLTSVFDKRSKLPELRDGDIRNRPREDYYAERPPAKSRSESEGSATPSSEEMEKSPSDTADQPSSNTPRITFRPQHERDPEAY